MFLNTDPPVACYSASVGGVYFYRGVPICGSVALKCHFDFLLLPFCTQIECPGFMRHIKLYERHQIKMYHRPVASLHPQKIFFLHTQEVACQMECFPDLFSAGWEKLIKNDKKKKSWEVARINRFDAKQYFFLLPVEPVSNWFWVFK